METRKNFIINAAFYAIIFALVAATYKYILPILTPFIIGFCVASVVQISLNRIKLKKSGQKCFLAVVLCIAFYSILVSLVIFFGAKVVTEIGNFCKDLPNLVQTQLYPLFLYAADRIMEVLAPIDSALAEWIIELGKTALQSLGQFATDFSAGAVKIVASGAASIPNVLVQIIITVVSSFYMAVDHRKVLSFLKNLIPESKRSFIIQTLRYAETAVLVYIKSYSILFLLTFLELWIGLSVLRIPYALGIAFGIAVFDLMPILGTGGILLPWAAVLLIMGNFPLAIGIALLYIIITVVRNALEPRIVGTQIGLHPLATMVAMILGLKLMGLIGMLLFPISLVAITNLRKSAKESTAAQQSQV